MNTLTIIYFIVTGAIWTLDISLALFCYCIVTNKIWFRESVSQNDKKRRLQ
jgi:hypothetical protein